MNKRLSTALAALSLAAFGLAPGASAQTMFGLGGGLATDNNSLFLGAQIRTAPGVSIPLRFNPGVDIYFPDDDATQIKFNANLLYNFGLNNTTFTPYAGAGLGVGYLKREDRDESDTDIGANFLFGAEFGFGRARPFAEVGVLTVNRTGAAVSGGILFSF